ncbi:unnamed protein product [Acanthoscelides obtectus]|uniref:Uncharacterized protein n=1 Tax=Acanthoscelides obtectus TaxID=200917 RepID=A0A9P0PME1_ACAOB|nr:unnamed protein product [Acanthoscelides obtectus]CAK1626146.1 hypothetical protein AOBTE_LOCUS3643 [Acanthoscelides obtectus]
MLGAKFGKWVNDNIVFLVGIPLIIGVHYGWSKLQQNPNLVPPDRQKKEPVLEIYRNFKNILLGERAPAVSVKK